MEVTLHEFAQGHRAIKLQLSLGALVRLQSNFKLLLHFQINLDQSLLQEAFPTSFTNSCNISPHNLNTLLSEYQKQLSKDLLADSTPNQGTSICCTYGP